MFDTAVAHARRHTHLIQRERLASASQLESAVVPLRWVLWD
jgi:hypothetical protein